MGPHPTAHGPCGTTRRGLTAGQGLPLAVGVAGAHRPARKRLAAPLDARVVERPAPTAAAPPHVCLGKGDDDDACHQGAEPHEDLPHLRCRGEEPREKPAMPGDRARRWVGEGWHAWLNRFRKLLVRFEKKLETQLALRQFAWAYMVLKRAEVFS
jgi:putative transposase